MQPKHFELFKDLKCDKRVKIYEDIILLYSAYLKICYDAKVSLANSLEVHYKIAPIDDPEKSMKTWV